MTKFQKAIIGILTVDVIAVFGCLALFVVTSGSGLITPAKNNSFVVATVTPYLERPTSTPVPPTQIPSCNVKEYLRLAEPIFQRFYDAMKLAGNTPRISLPSVISEMQSARREFQKLQAPWCANAFKQKASASMDAAIDAFVLFLGNAPDTSVQQKLREANDLIQDATDELDQLRRFDVFH